MSSSRPRRVLALGDLHLFTPHSRGQDDWDELPSQLQGIDDLVLLGDDFDFHWLTGLAVEEAVEKARGMIETLMERCPAVRIHVLQGNHDCHPSYGSMLDDLAARRENLASHPFELVLGDAAFMHGDAANKKGIDRATLERQRRRWGEIPPRRGPAAWVYRSLIRLGADRLAGWLLFPSRKTTTRLLRHLEGAGITAGHPIRQVVFGHVHRQIDGYETEGVRFWNAGAPIGTRSYRIIELEVRDD